MKLKCPECGNETKFYRDISIYAKVKVDKDGNDLKKVFDISKDRVDNYYEYIYCRFCDISVNEE